MFSPRTKGNDNQISTRNILLNDLDLERILPEANELKLALTALSVLQGPKSARHAKAAAEKALRYHNPCLSATKPFNFFLVRSLVQQQLVSAEMRLRNLSQAVRFF